VRVNLGNGHPPRAKLVIDVSIRNPEDGTCYHSLPLWVAPILVAPGPDGRRGSPLYGLMAAFRLLTELEDHFAGQHEWDTELEVQALQQFVSRELRGTHVRATCRTATSRDGKRYSVVDEIIPVSPATQLAP
jgi:hypothetical protein